MQAVSIAGLVMTLASLSQCALNTTFLPDVSDKVFTMDIPDRIRQVLDLPNTIGNSVNDKVVDKVDTASNIKLNLIDYLTDFLVSKTNSSGKVRRKRQSGIDIPIPTSPSFYRGNDDRSDDCKRDEVPFPDGDCYQILSEGPCDDTEFVLLDPFANVGYCAPRLCSPDRVFVFSDQRCHDPLEEDICPPGRQLFTSSYGTPICGCPDGLYEDDDDVDDDVCKPILDDIDDCPRGKVFWFKNFKSPPQCVPDPCNGENLKRGPKELPFVPSAFNGKCYQLGISHPVCRPGRFYTVDLETLLGVCVSLEDGGFTVLSRSELRKFKKLYGDPIPKDDFDEGSIGSTFVRPKFPNLPVPKHPSNSISSEDVSSNSKNPFFPFGNPFFPKQIPDHDSIEHFDGNSNFIAPHRFPASTVAIRPRMPHMGSSVVPVIPGGPERGPILVGQPVVGHFDMPKDTSNFVPLVPTHMTAFSPSFITVNGSISLLHFLHSNSINQNHHRSKRAPLPHASPSTVFQPGLSACRAGAARDFNFKCRNRVTPSQVPNSRPRRRVPPRPPTPSCNGGNVFGVTRSCTRSNRAASSLIAQGLG